LIETMKFTIVSILAVLPAASCFNTPTAQTAQAATSRLSKFALNAEPNGANGAASKKKVIVLGGDGFCGWPTSLYLSDQGHDVVIVDNLSRRNIDTELGCDSLTPISSPEVRKEKQAGQQ
jgi:UDP-sulfoquinovose synthase